MDMTKLRVLIADDESLHVMRLRAVLEELGHQVVAETSTGAEAVSLARSTRPELAILDIKMPDLDGIEVARQIMTEQPMPVLLLTAFSDDELVERAAEAGVFAYLVKPASTRDLRPAIRLARSRFGELMMLQQEVVDLRQALETRKLVERAKGVLMKRRNLSEEQAFKVLQERSQSESRKMGEIAQAVLLADTMF
jgi:AmiR/NasT family two-component response regulator